MSARTHARRVAVIGAGWAGLAAAVHACQLGAQVTLFEAAKVAGGRARTVHLLRADGSSVALDNGQHILIGAYQACLALMETVGVRPQHVLQRMPLDLRDAHGHGLRVPPWPRRPQLAGLYGIARACGWTWPTRLALLRLLASWQRSGFACPPGTTVAALCRHAPVQLMQQFVEPLCVAALNTPVQEACGQVFLRVLRDTLAGGPGSADLLLPTKPLGALLAEPALVWLARHGARIRLGERVTAVTRSRSAPVRATEHSRPGWQVMDEPFDAVIIATPVWETRRLLHGLAETAEGMGDCHALERWCEQAGTLFHEAIGTVYLEREAGRAATQPLLERPMLAQPGAVAQFAFDRQQLTGDEGITAWVASALKTDKNALQQAVLAQAQAISADASNWRVLATIVEKRATFVCHAQLHRPPSQPLTRWPSLAVAGDYVAGPYPATLEAAVRSGAAAAGRVLVHTMRV
ncbi:hypothetical protein AAV94_01925 [Lampropedia cohaerens]|uniref:Amine oxidase domain-containing protein n=1 Tax=Lampropedia cohaerens TaxID=1610491 RepID=A0A0U1Q338_9BURK|nr:hydroxysqualene dehydroxylase HpnE [Lampropedia cohaerens]KKW69159.1 hypothetical protein AAV94_01925 [Lampropedia cohaerens]